MNTINLRLVNTENTNYNYPICHPYSTMDRNCFNLLNISEGNGIYLYDVHGKEYIDASSGLWNISLGYGNQLIINQINIQLNKLPFCSFFDYTNETAVIAAKKILSLLPDYMNKVIFTCSGSESIDLSVKLMRKYWNIKNKLNKNIIISLKDSYHGTYYASLSVSGLEQDVIRGFEPLLPNIYFTSAGICSRCEGECNLQCMYEIENYIKLHKENIAGIIIEPILASKGVELLSSKYIDYVYNLCRDYDILLTIDEVATGFFRTGKSFYFMNFNIKPDIVCMAKGINSGYLPLGAVSIRKEIVKLFCDSNEMLIHGSTQGGNLLACAASIAAIDQYNDLDICKNVNLMGKYIVKELNKSLAYHKNVKEIRGVGLLIEIELVQYKGSNENLSPSQIMVFHKLLENKGLITYYSDLGITLLPMLHITIEEINKLLFILFEVFQHTIF